MEHIKLPCQTEKGCSNYKPNKTTYVCWIHGRLTYSPPGKCRLGPMRECPYKNKFIMTQEDKHILLKDLCARLPYEFTIHRYSDNRDITFGPNELDEFAHFLEYSEGKEFKPYLRPMSSITEEEFKEYHSMLIDVDNSGLMNQGLITKIVDWLDKKMFDHRCLIPMGLALEAPEGMYKTK